MSMDRRTFLKSGALTLGALATGCAAGLGGSGLASAPHISGNSSYKTDGQILSNIKRFCADAKYHGAFVHDVTRHFGLAFDIAERSNRVSGKIFLGGGE